MDSRVPGGPKDSGLDHIRSKIAGQVKILVPFYSFSNCDIDFIVTCEFHLTQEVLLQKLLCMSFVYFSQLGNP